MKSYYFILLSAMILSLLPIGVAAQPPDINMDLNFDKTSYTLGEPIQVTVALTNTGGSEILINKSFPDTVFYLKLRIIDPAGRLVGLVQNPGSGGAFPRGPVPVIFRDGQFIRVLAFETLPVGWSIISAADNILNFYLLNLPGPYSAKVQVSAIEFKANDPGNVENYEWQGLLESDTVYFNYDGSTQVNVLPDKWRLNWIDKPKEIKVQVWPDADKTVDDYQAGIKLNNLTPVRVKIVPSKIELYFDGKEAIESLGEVQIGEFHQVVLSGLLTDGTFFGGGQQIEIVN